MRRRAFVAGLGLAVAASACGSRFSSKTAAAARPATQDEADPLKGTLDDVLAGHTPVVVLGALHKAHLTSDGFSLEVIADVVRAVAPEVVLTEVPPDGFESALAEVDRLGKTASEDTIKDGWVRAFPEIYRVLMPLRRELGYELVPVSGWRPAVSRDRRAYYRKHPHGPSDETYRAAQAAYDEARRTNHAAENPHWVNGPDFRRVAGAARQALSNAADAELGAAAVMAINQAHYERILAAVQAHAGRRILLVYGAQHRWYFEPRLAKRPNVALVDVRPYLPS